MEIQNGERKPIRSLIFVVGGGEEVELTWHPHNIVETPVKFLQEVYTTCIFGN
jgi:hypothetical protein